MKNSSDTSWDRISHLPICSTATLTTVLPRKLSMETNNFNTHKVYKSHQVPTRKNIDNVVGFLQAAHCEAHVRIPGWI